MIEHLPHEDYIPAVYDLLGDLGAQPKDCWTETPDGQSLDGVITFEHVDPEEWPDGVYLAWSQKSGWSMITEGNNRTIYDLSLEAYANPKAVAAVVAQQLKEYTPNHEPVDQSWDGAEALDAAVTAWEASS